MSGKVGRPQKLTAEDARVALLAGLSYREIAAKHRCSVDAVRRAVKRLPPEIAELAQIKGGRMRETAQALPLEPGGAVTGELLPPLPQLEPNDTPEQERRNQRRLAQYAAMTGCMSRIQLDAIRLWHEITPEPPPEREEIDTAEIFEAVVAAVEPPAEEPLTEPEESRIH